MRTSYGQESVIKFVAIEQNEDGGIVIVFSRTVFAPGMTGYENQDLCLKINSNGFVCDPRFVVSFFEEIE
jgi:hypothetical protein